VYDTTGEGFKADDETAWVLSSRGSETEVEAGRGGSASRRENTTRVAAAMTTPKSTKSFVV